MGRRGPGPGPAGRSAATARREPDAQTAPGPPAGGLTAPCRSRLAGEEALEPCVACAGAFAGKPAPTGWRGRRAAGPR
ncbi:hypothetical protein EX349_13225 [Pseudomonas protegens]|nr:hypothetical protein [Pseudomonas sp. JV245A]NAN52158.1 hypothetical protein [Pseudomonas protegens]NUE74010.1 hypothetical protein [Pseudomonas protegens]